MPTTHKLDRQGKRRRLYSLYQRNETGLRWQRVADWVGTLNEARRVFQTTLINSVMSAMPELRIRPVKSESIEKIQKLRRT